MTRYVDQTDARLRLTEADYRDDVFHGLTWDFDSNAVSFHDCLFEQMHFRERAFELSEFKHCRFVNCHFDSAQVKECLFEDCHFYDRETELT